MENPDIYGSMFIDGINCVMFSNIEEFISKVKYYLENEDKRLDIVNNAYKCFLEKESWDHKVRDLIENL